VAFGDVVIKFFKDLFHPEEPAAVKA